MGARLTVSFGERPELVGQEDAVTDRHRRVRLRIEVLAERLQDGVLRDVVGVTDVT